MEELAKRLTARVADANAVVSDAVARLDDAFDPKLYYHFIAALQDVRRVVFKLDATLRDAIEEYEVERRKMWED